MVTPGVPSSHTPSRPSCRFVGAQRLLAQRDDQHLALHDVVVLHQLQIGGVRLAVRRRVFEVIHQRTQICGQFA